MKQVFLQDKSIDLWLETSLKKKKKKKKKKKREQTVIIFI